MAWSSKGPFLPPTSLQLLVPPVRVMSAFVWQVVQQHSVKQYDKLLDFISLVTEIVPELLSPTQKAQLVLGLRARLVLELCRSDGFGNLKTIQSHLDKIHTCSAELSASDQMESADILKTSYSNFASLVQNILNVPFEKKFFFQEVFPEKYGSAYNQRIQQLVSLFLSRLEQLLPIPDLQQTTAWLTDTFASEEFGLYMSSPETLKTLLLHHREMKTLSSAPSNNEEDVILSTLALPTHTAGERFGELHSEGDDEDEYESNEGSLALENLEEDSSQSSDVASADWVPKKKLDSPSNSSTCPQCSFTHLLKRKVEEHMQTEHHMTVPVQKKKSLRNLTKKIQQKSQNVKAEKKKQGDTEKLRRCKQKDGKKLQHKQKDNVDKKKRLRKKVSAGEDKRFLSARPVIKNFPEKETRCPKCEKVFEHPNQLKTHRKIHSFRYRCCQCEKGFTSQSGYYQHQRLHKRGRRFTCKQCNKGFLCSYSLKQHEHLHNGPTNLCNICGKNFSKNGFIRHMQMHRGERNYLCTTCGKSFLSSGELLLHNRTHTGELPYTCEQCGKGFSCKSHLNVHMRSHTGERPYLCSECPKRFLTANCLRRHMLSHNGVKPFKCSDCGREFSQQGNLKRHMTTHKADS
ncbi:zinc finger protein 436-like isoform X2 [Melanotaenia boesemani]|uniref:zinc finger protein 436-like isoform X2 n=1 Tax=Melanotaenia boesemani TaxID=1250792 RepID=UPI001C03A4C0|nr:zinc finger protein 436-like isoform X2 [Melanotaenia boesemani]